MADKNREYYHLCAVIPALRKLRQVCHKSEVSLGYIMNLRPISELIYIEILRQKPGIENSMYL